MNTIPLRSLALAVALAPAVAAQVAPETARAIKREGLENSHAMAILDELTNGIGPRLTGSDNFTRACAWAKAKFEEFGIEDVQLEKWATWPLVWNRGQWMGRVVEPIELELQVATEAWTPGTKGIVRGRLMMAPTTEEELAAMRDQLEGAYLFRTGGGGRARRGRRGGGNAEDPAAAARRAFQQKLAAAVEVHPIAGWVQSSTGDARYPNRIRVFGRRPNSIEQIPKIPSIVVRNDQARQLRKLLQDVREVVVEFDVRNRFRLEPIDLHNVIAEIPGTEHPEEVVVVCGHLDSWHQATGTTDNGTGTTTTLEAARILAAVGAKPKRTIRFCLWGGEEQGLLGSQQHTTMRRTELDEVSACFNHDTGTNWAQGLTVTEAQYDDMLKVFAPVMSMTPPDPDFDGPVFELRKVSRLRAGGGSDHASFQRAGVPGLSWRLRGRSDYFGRTWHSQWDTYDAAIPEYQRHTSTVIALAALGTANLPNLLSREGVARAAGTDVKPVLEGVLGVTFGGAGDLTIGAVEKDGRGDKIGFEQGDRIVKVGGEDVSALLDVMNRAFRSQAEEGSFTVRRRGELVELGFKRADLGGRGRGRGRGRGGRGG